MDRVLEHREELRVALAALELAREQQWRAPLGVLGARTRTCVDTLGLCGRVSGPSDGSAEAGRGGPRRALRSWAGAERGLALREASGGGGAPGRGPEAVPPLLLDLGAYPCAAAPVPRQGQG